MQERKDGFNREAVPRSWGKNELKRCKREDDFNCHNVNSRKWFKKLIEEWFKKKTI